MVAPWTRVSCGRTTRTRWLAKTATSRIDIAITWVVISASMVHCAMSDNMVCRTAPVAMSNASRSSPSAKWCETTKTGTTATTATASTQPYNTPFDFSPTSPRWARTWFRAQPAWTTARSTGACLGISGGRETRVSLGFLCGEPVQRVVVTEEHRDGGTQVRRSLPETTTGDTQCTMVKKSGRKSAGGGGQVVSEMGDGPVRGT